MRTIKFRVWDKEEKKFFPIEDNKSGKEMPVCNVVIRGDGKVLWLEENLVEDQAKVRIFLPEEVEVQFFTGLHDGTKWEELSKKEQGDWLSSGKEKNDWNGKEIYEGDILQSSRSTGLVTRKISDVLQFDFEGVVYGWQIGTEFPNDDSMVIGNIYESPELIK